MNEYIEIDGWLDSWIDQRMNKMDEWINDCLWQTKVTSFKPNKIRLNQKKKKKL